MLNPGVVDTELFGLPDNDASIADVEPVPVTDVIEPVVDMLRTGTVRGVRPRLVRGCGASEVSATRRPTSRAASPTRVIDSSSWAWILE